MWRLYSASRPIERYPVVEVSDYPRMRQGPVRVRLADVFVPMTAAGDLLEIDFGMQVTNDLLYPVETGTHLVWTPWPTGIAGIVITPERGANAMWQVPGQGGEHHKAIERSAKFEIPEHCDGPGYVAAIFLTGGGSNSAWGDYLKIDVGQGDLTVKHTLKPAP